MVLWYLNTDKISQNYYNSRCKMFGYCTNRSIHYSNISTNKSYFELATMAYY